MNDIYDTNERKKEKIKDRFKRSLKFRNMTQKKIAEISKASTRTVSRCANEGILSEKYAKKFASILKLSYEYLLCESDDPNYEIFEDINFVSDDNSNISKLFEKISYYDKDIMPMLNKIQKNWDLIDSETKKSFIYGLHFVLYLINNIKGLKIL
jgi:transcriptional regulator with XRE-family HTH domain